MIVPSSLERSLNPHRTDLSDDQGRPFRLLNQLVGAAGGEGQIWETESPSLVAKIYFRGDPERDRKLQWMLTNPPTDPTASLGHVSIAWPTRLLKTPYSSGWQGFVMPRARDAVSLATVYNTQSRNRWNAGFNWQYLHQTALNIASTVDAVHQIRCIVGDLKPENFLVNSKALITLVDADSIQVPRPGGGYFRCPVGTSGFLPHELLGVTLTGADRTERHDAFALGVILYLLLCGQHPFQGGSTRKEPPDENEAIANGWWKHGPGSPVTELPSHVALTSLHPEVQSLFRSCFSDGHRDPSRRPSASAWKSALTRAVSSLRKCSSNSNHWYSSHEFSCYWCVRRARIGFDIFDPAQMASVRVRAAGAKSARPLPQLRVAPMPTPQPPRPTCSHCQSSGHASYNCPSIQPAPRTCSGCGMTGHDVQSCPNVRRCSNCGDTGHNIRTCPSAGSARTCSGCGDTDHDLRTCPHVRRCSHCRDAGHDIRNCPSVARRSASSGRCKKTKADGKRCTASAQPGNYGFCYRHR
jgi:DNA-binding helix-hairpin-helix protein with protein kinase domain